MSTDRHHSGTDLALGLVAEGQQRCRLESCMLVAGRRVDVEEARSLCVFDRLSRH